MFTSNIELDVGGLRTLTLDSHSRVRARVIAFPQRSGDQLLRGEYDPDVRIIASRSGAGAVDDVVGTYWAHVVLISPRFRDVLARHHLSGWSAHALTTEDPADALADFSLLSIIGRSGKVYRGSKNQVGQYLDARGWDGSDLFLPVNWRGILVTAAAAGLLETAGLRNCKLELAGLEPLHQRP